MGNEVVRAIAELQRRVAALERPRTAAPTVPVLASVTKTISDVRIADATANQALHDANNITETQITDGAIRSPHIATNALDGKVITGSTIRTSASYPSIRLSGDKLTSYYADGTRQQSFSTGVSTGDGGLWTYRQDGSKSSSVQSEGIWLYDGAGNVNVRLYSPVEYEDAYSIWTNWGMRVGSNNSGAEGHFAGDRIIIRDTSSESTETAALRMWISEVNTPRACINGLGGMQIMGDGVTGLDVYSSGVAFTNYLYANYFQTTTAAANLHRSSTDAQIYLVTSNGYNKLDQADIGLTEAEALLEVAPKTWMDRRDADNPDAQRIPGFVAEDVAAASQAHGGALDPLLTTGSDTLGTAYMGVNYDRVAAYLIPLIRDLRERVAALETT